MADDKTVYADLYKMARHRSSNAQPAASGAPPADSGSPRGADVQKVGDDAFAAGFKREQISTIKRRR